MIMNGLFTVKSLRDMKQSHDANTSNALGMVVEEDETYKENNKKDSIFRSNYNLQKND